MLIECENTLGFRSSAAHVHCTILYTELWARYQVSTNTYLMQSPESAMEYSQVLYLFIATKSRQGWWSASESDTRLHKRSSGPYCTT